MFMGLLLVLSSSTKNIKTKRQLEAEATKAL